MAADRWGSVRMADNPFQQIKTQLVDEMMSLSDEWHDMASGVQPFNSQKMSPEEDRFIFENPAAVYENYTHPQTGQPLTNAQAAKTLLDGGVLINQQGQPERVFGMGPHKYVEWVQGHAKRIQNEHAAPETGDPVVNDQGYSMGAEGGLNDLLQQGGP